MGKGSDWRILHRLGDYWNHIILLGNGDVINIDYNEKYDDAINLCIHSFLL